MRIRADIQADVPSLPWEDVHGPARAVAYELVRGQNAELARELHNDGWKGSPLRPLGLTSPQFASAVKKPEAYITSPDGEIWFGSPVPEIAAALFSALADRSEIRWGRAKLRIRDLYIDTPTPTAGHVCELATLTPVLLKQDSRYLLPGEPHYLDRMWHNLTHKADLLDLPAPTDIQVLHNGRRRRFLVKGVSHIGAPVTIRMVADPRFIDAIRSWGLGLNTVQGFGWVK